MDGSDNEVLAKFAQAGVDITSAAKLRDERAEIIRQVLDDLMGVIASKSAVFGTAA